MAPIKRHITRREFLQAAGVTGLGLGLATWAPFAPTAAAAARERTVVAPATQRARKIRVTTIPGGAGSNIKYAADNFMQKYTDIEVQVDIAGGAETEYKPNFPQIAVSADRPDVAWYWVDGRQYQDLVAAGALEALDEVYASEGLDKAYPEATLTKYTSPDGHRYAVNTDVVWYPQVYYNKAIFKECGIEPPADGIAYQSLDEWYQVCDKCRAKGYEPVTVGAKEGWRIGHIHDTLLQRMIPQDLLNDLYENWRPGSEPKISYSGPEWVAVDKLLKEWFDKGVFAEGDLGRSYSEGRAIFVQNKAAMYQDGSWAVSILRSEAPDLDFGWMLYPQVKPEIKPRFLLYAGNGVMVPKDPSDRDAAMKFAAYITSLEYETLMIQNQEIGFAPSRVDVPADAMATLEPMVREMWLKLIEIGTSTGWDDPVPADMAERSFILFQEMLTGVREPETVGEEIGKIVERHRAS
jgi:ABC-type glycerol-3-phosphate transport system substrate-binding protein